MVGMPAHRAAGGPRRAGGDALHPSCLTAPRQQAERTGRPCGARTASLAIACTHGPGASRPADRDRRVLPASGGAHLAHARRRADDVRGPAAAVHRGARHAAAGACTSSRATARSWRCRPPARAARCGSTTRASTSSTTCATPRCRSPGSEEQLLLLAGRVFSQQLDRSKPLWEIWMVEGLEGGGFALITKTHHALIDGIAGVDLAQVIFDLGPVPAEVPHPDEAWAPAPTPSRREVLASGTLGLLRTGVRTAARRGVARHAPGGGAALARASAVEGLGEVAWAGLNPAPADAAERRDRAAPPLPRGAQRAGRLQGGQGRLRRHGQRRRADRRQRRAARWLQSRGVRTEGLELRALVPGLDPRRGRARDHGQPDRRHARPAAGLRRGPDRCACARSSEAMDGLKESKQAVGAEVLASVQNFAPADDPRAGLAPELLHPPVQPDRDERARPAVPALRARARAARRLPGRLPAQGPRAGDRDHVLQRRA